MNTKFFAMTAALAVAGSVSAFAWDATELKARVDFPFKAFSASMPAGDYKVVKESGNRFYLSTAHKKIVLAARSVSMTTGARPSLTFRCDASACGLVGISTGDQSYTTTKPTTGASDKERLVTVYLDRVTGE